MAELPCMRCGELIPQGKQVVLWKKSEKKSLAIKFLCEKCAKNLQDSGEMEEVKLEP